MENTKKMTILKLISDNKALLFGKFSNSITFDMKIKKWKDIAQQLKEMGIYDKDWKYLRDTTWQNWRKRTIDKRDNRQKTGSAGGKKFKYDEADEMILNIVGKNTPVLEGLDVPESSGSQATIEIPQAKNSESTPHNSLNNQNSANDNSEPTPHNSQHSQNSANKNGEPAPHNAQNNQNSANTRIYSKSVLRLKKEKLEAEILLIKEKTEIAKREKYKLDLELFKLEKELNITQISSYTEPYHNQSVIEINLVQIAESEQDNVRLSRGNTC